MLYLLKKLKVEYAKIGYRCGKAPLQLAANGNTENTAKRGIRRKAYQITVTDEAGENQCGKQRRVSSDLSLSIYAVGFPATHYPDSKRMGTRRCK